MTTNIKQEGVTSIPHHHLSRIGVRIALFHDLIQNKTVTNELLHSVITNCYQDLNEADKQNFLKKLHNEYSGTPLFKSKNEEEMLYIQRFIENEIKASKKPTVGIMGAMPEEIKGIHNLMTNVVIEKMGDSQYHIGKINGLDVVLVFSQWGKVASAHTATVLVSKYGVDILIFTGVAGAVNKELNIGDVVVATKSFQHDMDARPLMAKHEIPLSNGRKFYESDPVLVEIACDATREFFKEQLSIIPRELLEKFNIVNPKFVAGIIATGDQFISTQEATAIIEKETECTQSTDMETGAVMAVCGKWNVKCVVVRTMSDKANHSSHIDFPSFIQDIAAVYSQGIIGRILQSPKLSI